MGDMIVVILFVLSVIFMIYGAMIYMRMHTPYVAKVTVKKEFVDAWCRTEGISRMLLGVDVTFLAMYYARMTPVILWIGCFIAVTIYIIIMRYNNNQKYMKR